MLISPWFLTWPFLSISLTTLSEPVTVLLPSLSILSSPSPINSPSFKSIILPKPNSLFFLNFFSNNDFSDGNFCSLDWSSKLNKSSKLLTLGAKDWPFFTYGNLSPYSSSSANILLPYAVSLRDSKDWFSAIIFFLFSKPSLMFL